MPKILRIPLSATVAQRFAQRAAEIQRLTDQQNTEITVLIADKVSPVEFVAIIGSWGKELTETEIVCTPPADSGLVEE